MDETLKWVIDPFRPDSLLLQQAARYIQQGQLVAFPTETVYGLGANAFDAAAVAKIFVAKGRPADNPLIVHVADFAGLEEVAYPNEMAKKLAAQFWPGPLTLVLPRKSTVPKIVSAGLNTVAVRLPSHPVAVGLIRSAGVPIAAPSANASGRPSPTRAEHVMFDLRGKIPLILDGGPVEIGVESTVVDLCGEVPVLLRPGKITAEQLKSVCGVLQFAGQASAKCPSSPGMKYKHYAPKAQVYVIEDAEQMGQKLADLRRQGMEPLLLGFDKLLAQMPADSHAYVLGKQGDLEAFAQHLFEAFRFADTQGFAAILVQTVPPQGFGRAIMNRLSKAAGVVNKT